MNAHAFPPPADDDEFVEMANLSPAKTGVDGIIYISTRQGRHGPRVKYFVQPGGAQPSFSVSISDRPEVVANSLPEPMARRAAPQVIAWVDLNRGALLSFWHSGDTWLDEQVEAFKAGLHRLPS